MATFSSSAAELVNGTTYLLVVAHNASTGNSKRWLNSATGTEGTHTFGATTSAAQGPLTIGAETEGGNVMAQNSEILWAAAGHAYYPTDSDITALIARLQSRGKSW